MYRHIFFCHFTQTIYSFVIQNSFFQKSSFCISIFLFQKINPIFPKLFCILQFFSSDMEHFFHMQFCKCTAGKIKIHIFSTLICRQYLIVRIQCQQCQTLHVCMYQIIFFQHFQIYRIFLFIFTCGRNFHFP